MNKHNLEVCEWEIDETNEDENVWNTSCGNKYIIITGSPKDNHMNFCPYCGKTLLGVYRRFDDD